MVEKEDPVAGRGGEGPETSMVAAAEVVEAMAVAASGRGWLCVPS